MRNLHFPVLQLHGILYIIERRVIHLIFAKNKRMCFLKLKVSLPLLARSCENDPNEKAVLPNTDPWGTPHLRLSSTDEYKYIVYIYI